VLSARPGSFVPRISRCLLHASVLAPALGVVAACGNLPDLNVSPVYSLQLGRSTRKDYEAAFGDPHATRVVQDDTGRYELASYTRKLENFSGTCLRMVQIELKGGVLNAYLAGSSCDDDRTSVASQSASALMQGRGTMTVDDVVRRMGKPSGIARCPSRIGTFNEICKDSVEARAWFEVPEQGLLGGTLRAAMVAVSFDANRRLRNVRIVEKER